MSKPFFSKLIVAVFSMFSLIQVCEDIKFDYEKYPFHPFDITHAELRLDIDPDSKLLSGQVTYTFHAKAANLSVISMHGAELSISELTMDSDQVDFEVRGDTIDVLLNNEIEPGDEHKLTIQWQTQSDFGLFKDHIGNMWSSMNPLSHRHWMPGFDHPREQFTVDAYLSIPLGLEVFFNGNLEETLVIAENKKRVHWTTEKEINTTGIGFVVGDFVISEMTAGFTKVRLFHVAGKEEQSIANDVIVEAARLKKEIENTLSFEYPHETLNMVLLPDNMWMERTHGTGTVYLFERLGNLKAQLARNLSIQWFGEYQFNESYLHLENEGVNGLLPSALHYRISDRSALIENPDTLWSIQHWNRWQTAYQQEESVFTRTISESLPDLMRVYKGITNFDEYADFWYKKTGISWRKPTPTMFKDSLMDEAFPSYQLDLLYDEVDSDLTILFELEKGRGKQLYSTELLVYEFDKVSTHEINFTGELDTVKMSVPATTEFIILNETEFPLDSLTIRQAPLYFLLNQLRSDAPEHRINAAKLLKLHGENPDLQLALSDILSFEENPEVIAAIYTALAELTNGATGTEEQFIRGLNNESISIQLASIRALLNYAPNEYVRSSLRTKLLRAEGEVFDASVEIYTQISGAEEQLGTLSALQRRDTVGARTLSFLMGSDSLYFNDEALAVAEEYQTTEYPFTIRKTALGYLELSDTDADRWKNRIQELITDSDPRVRFWAVEKAPRFLLNDAYQLILEGSLIDEMDPRVKALMLAVIEENS